MADKNYAILRIVKMSRNNIQAMKKRCEHVNRVDYADNVNPALSYLNRTVIGTENANWFDLYKSRYDELDFYKIPGVPKMRKDTIIGLEVVVSMSHDMKDIIDIDEWVEANNKWMQNYFGKENVVHSVLHMDESTLHIHYFITPVLDGKFNGSELLGNKQKFRERHTSYSKAMEPFGLKRGLQRGYRAPHEELAQMYSSLHEITNLPEVIDGGETAEEYRERHNKYHRGLQARIKYLEHEIGDFKITQDYATDLEQEKYKLQDEVNKLKEERDTLTIGGVSVKSLIAAVEHCTDRDGINEYIELFKVLEKRGDSYLKEMDEIEQNTNSIKDI